MDNASVSSSANVLGIATGAMTLLGLAFYRSHLPKSRYKALEEVLKDTEETWGIESPLFRNQEFRDNIEEQLVSLRSDVYKHRERALGDITLKYQYKEFFKGLSMAMNQTYNEIECVRALIITIAATELEQRRVERSPSSEPSNTTRESERVPSPAERGDTEPDYPPSHPVTVEQDTSRPSQSPESPFPVATHSEEGDEIPLQSMTTAHTPPMPPPGPVPSHRHAASMGPWPWVGRPDERDAVAMSRPPSPPNLDFEFRPRGKPSRPIQLNNYLQMRGISQHGMTWRDTRTGSMWTCTVSINGVEYGRASGDSRSFARDEAARLALAALSDPA